MQSPIPIFILDLRNSQNIVFATVFVSIHFTAFNCLASLFFECYSATLLSQFVHVRLLRVI